MHTTATPAALIDGLWTLLMMANALDGDYAWQKPGKPSSNI